SGDWSSDVCSSDLRRAGPRQPGRQRDRSCDRLLPVNGHPNVLNAVQRAPPSTNGGTPLGSRHTRVMSAPLMIDGIAAFNSLRRGGSKTLALTNFLGLSELSPSYVHISGDGAHERSTALPQRIAQGGVSCRN